MNKKNILYTLVFVGLWQLCTAQPNPRPVIVSPEVHTDNTVTFRFYAPAAKEVKLNVQFEK